MCAAARHRPAGLVFNPFARTARPPENNCCTVADTTLNPLFNLLERRDYIAIAQHPQLPGARGRAGCLFEEHGSSCSEHMQSFVSQQDDSAAGGRSIIEELSLLSHTSRRSFPRSVFRGRLSWWGMGPAVSSRRRRSNDTSVCVGCRICFSLSQPGTQRLPRVHRSQPLQNRRPARGRWH